MAVVKMKEPVQAQIRTADSKCPEGVRCEIAVANGQTIITDEPEERGGGNSAASPLQHFTASLAACQTVQVVKVAEAMRFKHGAIDIVATTTTDRVPAVDGKDKVMRFRAAGMEINIETDETPERIERLKKISEDRCPVGNLFADAGFEPVVSWNILPLKS